jgi:hypothetical protein
LASYHPGPSAHRALEATLQAPYACSPGRCPAFRGAVMTFSFQGLIYRLFCCELCAAMVLICSKCDFGHRYCCKEHSKEGRRQKHANAQAHHQEEHHEAWKDAHRTAQKKYRDGERERKQAQAAQRAASRVTDHTLLGRPEPIKVHAIPATDTTSERPIETLFRDKPMCCMFCKRVLASFASISTRRWTE